MAPKRATESGESRAVPPELDKDGQPKVAGRTAFSDRELHFEPSTRSGWAQCGAAVVPPSVCVCVCVCVCVLLPLAREAASHGAVVTGWADLERSGDCAAGEGRMHRVGNRRRLVDVVGGVGVCNRRIGESM
jgi:hypothetical protein